MSHFPQNASTSCLVAAAFDVSTLEDAARGCRERLGRVPDLVLAFVSSDYRPHLPSLIETLQIDGHASRIVGCSASGIFGVSKEHENACGVSLLFLAFADASTTILSGEHRLLDAKGLPTAPAGLMLFGNPLKTDLSEVIHSLNTRYPGSPIAGGFATGGPEPPDVFLFTHEGLIAEGALAVCFNKGVRLSPLISQGCRPIGAPLVVTGTSRDEVISIGRRRAFTVLEDTFESLPEELQKDAAGRIYAGLAISEEVDEFETGNFLIRHIIGADLERGHLKIATTPRVGQTIQFQLRDSCAAEASLRSECSRIFEEHGKPFAAILCSGRGRGKMLHEAEDRDILVFEEAIGKTPLAGLFTNGEVAPVSGTIFRHDHAFCGLLLYDTESVS